MKMTFVAMAAIGLVCVALNSSAQKPPVVPAPPGPAWAALPPPNAIPQGAVLKYSPPLALSGDPPSPSPSASFLAVAFQASFDNFWPDVAGAAGPTNVMVTLQNSVLAQDRAGNGATATNSLGTFWGAGRTNFPFDPRIIYDPYAGRWIASVAWDQGAPYASLHMAVSKTSDPTYPSGIPSNYWYFASLDADTDHIRWADFPQIGFNKDWIVMTANMYRTNSTSSNDFLFTKLWVFNKSNAYAGTFTFTNLTGETNPPYVYSLAPSLVYDPAATNMFLVSAWTTNALRVYELSGPVGSEAIMAMTNMPAVTNQPPWSTDDGNNNFLPQTNSTKGVFAADHRFLSPAVQRNGFLWVAHHIFLPYGSPTHTAVQWWQISLTDFSPVAVRRLEDASGATSYAYPSIGVNRYGDALLGYSRFSPSQSPSSNYDFHDGFDGAGRLLGDTVLHAGQAPLPRTTARTITTCAGATSARRSLTRWTTLPCGPSRSTRDQPTWCLTALGAPNEA